MVWQIFQALLLSLVLAHFLTERLLAALVKSKYMPAKFDGEPIYSKGRKA